MATTLYRRVVTTEWQRIEIGDDEVGVLQPLVDDGDFPPGLLTPVQRSVLRRIVEADVDWKTVEVMDEEVTHYELESHS